MSGDGYTPVFATVFDGSLCGKWPDSAVWLTMLALCDKRGNVDMSYQAIASRTGWPMELLRQGIAGLMEPDPESRSPAEEGRRLTALDPQRGWGWHVVNHTAYREKARLMAQNASQVEDGRNADKCRRYREKLAAAAPVDTARHPETPETPSDTLSNTNANTDKNPLPQKTSSSSGSPSKRAGKKLKTTLPEGFVLDEELRQYAEERLPEVHPDRFFESFCGKAKAKSWTYADWRQAFQEFVRNCAPNSGHWAAAQYPKRGGNVKWM